MIRTRVVEAVMGPTKVEEVELGWCLMAEVPVEKKTPQAPLPGQPPPMPMAIKVNGTNYFVIGHSWEIKTSDTVVSAHDATLVLIVQKIDMSPSGLVKAPAVALKQLDQMTGGGPNGRRLS